MSGTRYDQFCALARAAEMLGERWTLLIVRELLLGPKRFGDLAARLDGISPTVLTARLNRLVEDGLVHRSTLPPPFNAPVYALTPVGLGLRPAIRELIRWGGQFLFPVRPGETFEPDWALLALDAIARRAPSPARRIVLRLTQGDKAARLVVEGGRKGTTIAGGEEAGKSAGEATIEAGFDILLRLLSGALPIDEAIAEGLVRVEGSRAAARDLPRLFDLAERRKEGADPGPRSTIH